MQTVIVLVIVAASVVYVARYFMKGLKKSNRKSCGSCKGE